MHNPLATMRGLVAAALMLCLSAPFVHASAQSRRAAPPEKSLDDVVQDTLASQHIPGAVVAIIHADSLLMLRAYGRTALEADAPALEPDAVFRAAAVTELVNALTATTLAAQGRVDLDRPLGTSVSNVPTELRSATLGQLLSHTAGLARLVAVPGRGGADDLGAAARALTRFDSMTEPGLLHSYSRTGRALSALALERAANQPWAALVAATVFAPLAMHASSLSLPEVDARLTPGWRSTFMPGDRVGSVRPLPDSAVHVPIRGLYTTAPDLGRLVAAVLSDGVVQGERVLPEGAAAGVWRVRASVPASAVQAATGVRIGTWEGRPSVLISGGETGYSALVHMLPEERLGVVVLTNNESASVEAISDFALRRLLELPPREPTRRTAAATLDSAAEAAALDLLLAHAGPYENGSELIEILEQDGRPMLRSDDLLLPVRPLGDDAYGALLDGTRVGLVFHLIRDERGRTYLWLGDRALSPEAVRRAPRR